MSKQPESSTFSFSLPCSYKAEDLNSYRDIVQAATDLSEGRLQVMMSSYAILQPHVQAGRIKVLAVNGHERTKILPDVPTANESGFPALPTAR